MHLQSTYTPYLQYLQSEAHLKSSRTSRWSFFAEMVNVLTLIWVSFLGVRFEVGGGGGGKIAPPV